MKDYFQYEMGKRDCIEGNPVKVGMGDKYYEGYSDQLTIQQLELGAGNE